MNDQTLNIGMFWNTVVIESENDGEKCYHRWLDARCLSDDYKTSIRDDMELYLLNCFCFLCLFFILEYIVVKRMLYCENMIWQTFVMGTQYSAPIFSIYVRESMIDYDMSVM